MPEMSKTAKTQADRAIRKLTKEFRGTDFTNGLDDEAGYALTDAVYSEEVSRMGYRNETDEQYERWWAWREYVEQGVIQNCTETDDQGSEAPQTREGTAMAGIHWNEAHDTVWFTDEEEPTAHYHVVAFMPGCLNDYDSGPIDDIESARVVLKELADDYPEGDPMVPGGKDRYTNAFYILKIEECTESCDPDADY